MAASSVKYCLIEEILRSSQEAIWHTLIMCTFMDNLQSRITPRFLTLFTNGTTLEPNFMDIGRSLSELEVATRRASVLPSFNCSFPWT